MKRSLLSLLFLVAAGFASSASLALTQDVTPTPLTQPLNGYYVYGQLNGATTEEAVSGSGAATTIPMGPYSVTASRDFNHYTGVLVGRSPFFHGSRTTNVPTFIVPVKIHLPDGGI